MVQTARRAFWNGDLEAAEAAYIEAIARYPDDPDLFGELGNLYVSMGRRQRALDAFYESALRLRATGESEKLSEVIDLLESHGYPQEVQSGAQTGR
jgi:tetratricopeptide (TPR) repeat protein